MLILTLIGSKEWITSLFSQQKATGTLHLLGDCGFESCEEHVRRFHTIRYENRDICITWPERAPEDDIIFKIDKIQLQMRSLGEYSGRTCEAYIELLRQKNQHVQELYSKLVVRFEISKKMGLVSDRFQSVEAMLSSEERYLRDEEQWWVKIHGKEASRSTMFIIRSSLVT